jgi:hypothetical protein
VRILARSLLTLSLAIGCGSSADRGGAGSGATTGNGGATSGPGAIASSSVTSGAGGLSGSAASTSGASSSSGNASSSGSASSSGASSGGQDGGGPSSGDCQSDADCPSGACVPVTPGGFRVCQMPPAPATSCPGPLDQCCPATQELCPNGESCYAGPLVPVCTGTPVPMQNQCGVDQCTQDVDCAPGQICALAGTLGLQIRACVTAYCKTDADCAAHPGGLCAPVLEPCCSTNAGLYCVYASEGGCRSDAECPATSTQPHRFCAPGAAGVATCLSGAPDCPQ